MATRGQEGYAVMIRTALGADIANGRARAFEIGQTGWREKNACKDKGGRNKWRNLGCEVDKRDGIRLKGGSEGMRESILR